MVENFNSRIKRQNVPKNSKGPTTPYSVVGPFENYTGGGDRPAAGASDQANRPRPTDPPNRRKRTDIEPILFTDMNQWC